MKFVFHIFQGSTPVPGSEAWSALPAAQQQQIYADYGALQRTLGVEPGLPLGTAKTTRTLQVREGQTVVREGPHLSEGVSGYVLVEAESVEAAIEIAAKIPAARLGGAVEIRTVEKYW